MSDKPSSRHSLSIKRLKTSLNESEVLPGGFLPKIFSFCCLETLITIQGVCQKFKQHAEREFKQRVVNELPIFYCNDDSSELNVVAKLSNGWSTEHSSRANLIEKALGNISNIGGEEISHGIDYFDDDQLRQLLGRRGWVDVEDFIKEDNEDEDVEEEDDNDNHFQYRASLKGKRRAHIFHENGWGVDICFEKGLSRTQALARCCRMLNELKERREEMFGDEKIPQAARRNKRLIFNLLSSATSIQFAYFNQDIRHTDYPSKESISALMFVSHGSKFELVHTNQEEQF